MLKLGITGYSSCHHSRVFASLINGEVGQVENRLGVLEVVPELGEIAHIEKVFDPDQPAEAEALARDFGIPHIAKTKEEFIEGLDGVMLLTGNLAQHQKHAPFYLRAGTPIYVDKPLSYKYEEAHDVIQLAKETGTPFVTCAASSFDDQVVELKRTLGEVGKVLTATAAGPAHSSLVFYAVHEVDILFAVLGSDVVAVHHIGEPEKHLVKLTYGNGMVCMLQAYNHTASRFHLLVIGTEGWKKIYVHDQRNFFGNFTRAFAKMIETGEPPIPLDRQLKVIRVLTAAERSLIQGREVRIA